MTTTWTTLELAEIRGVRLEPGSDLRAERESVDLAGFAGATVLSCVGSLRETHLRMAGASEIWTSDQPVEIVSLVGTLSHDGVHFHLSVSLPKGEVVGGHLSTGTIVRTTAEIMVAFLKGPRLVRRSDPATGFKELSFESETEHS